MPVLRRLLLACCLLPMLLTNSGATEIQSVKVLSPSWATFTNADGTGLYFDLLKAVFSDLYGIEVRHEFTPSLRATHLVASAEADIMTCKARVEAPLVMSTYPMYENAYYVFFNKANIGEWKGQESMKGRSVVWRISYYDERYIPQGMDTREVKSGSSALGMVLLGRMDFYLDDLNFIEDSITANKIDFDMEDFRIEPIGRRTYHPVLNTPPARTQDQGTVRCGHGAPVPHRRTARYL